MPCADQVPVKNPHSTMRWHKWVVLIAGSTGSALRAVRPPNLHITPVVRRDLVYHRGLLTDQQVASPMQRQATLLLACLGRYEPHIGSGDCLTDRLGVNRIVLMPLHIGR